MTATCPPHDWQKYVKAVHGRHKIIYKKCRKCPRDKKLATVPIEQPLR